jgi:hypothetical protein
MADLKTEVVTFEQATALTGNKAVAFFSDAENVLPLIEQVKTEYLSLIPDLTTKKGRDAIGTNALNISKSRGVLEDAIDNSVSSMVTKVKKAKEVKKVVIAELNAARETVLAPRKEWKREQDKIEEARIDAIKLKIKGISDVGLFNITDTKEDLSSKIDALENIDVSSSFEEFTAQAASTINEAISSLNARILKIIEEKKTEDQRVQLAAEQKKTKIQERLSTLVQIPLGLMGKDSLLIQKKINSLEGFQITDEEFEERAEEAVNSLNQVVSQLKIMHSQAEQLEKIKNQEEEERAQDLAHYEYTHALAIVENKKFDAEKALTATEDVRKVPLAIEVIQNQVHTESTIEVDQQKPSKEFPFTSQRQNDTDAIEAQATHNPLHADFIVWSRNHKIDSTAFLELETLINKHFS